MVVFRFWRIGSFDWSFGRSMVAHWSMLGPLVCLQSLGDFMFHRSLSGRLVVL